MIIGITGYPGSGKDTAAYYFVRKNFFRYSLSDLLRDELKKKGRKITRENLIKLGNSLRKKYGNGILAKRVLEKLIPGKNYVVTSIYNTGEIEVLKERGDFILIFVDAPLELRQERLEQRDREKDPKTKKGIKKLDKKHSDKKSFGLQSDKCKKMADIIINNNSSLDDLYKKIDIILEKVRNNNKNKQEREDKTLRSENIRKRPSKDEYYLDIAKSVSERSTCLSVKMGAVIVKNDHIVSTGYVGAPRGTKDSIEWGFCLRRKLKIPSGHRYELCRSVHAEMNAIINAARSGVSVIDGTMYLYGEKLHEGKGKRIDVFPCFICKKMIINAGIKRFIAGRENGSFKIFKIEDWIEEWKQKDMIHDIDVYDAGKYK